MLTEQELLIRAKDWAEELWGVVPAEHLQAVLHKAFQTHESTFPVNAYDLKKAWDVIQTEGLVAESQRLMSGREKIDHCINHKNHVNYEGEVLIFIHGVTDDDVLMPCRDCRPEEHIELRGKLIDAKPRHGMRVV